MAGAPAPFDADLIRAQLGEDQARALRGLTLLEETDSTNRALSAMPPAERHARAVIAGSQTAGRGRRDRHWHSPPGGNLYLSFGWRFEQAPGALVTLPLACAVIAARELERLGARDLGIKWPNDLQIGGRKLGGLLVESQVGGRASTDVVIGIGINVRMPPGTATDAAISQAWTDLASQCGDRSGTALRDTLAGRLVGGLLRGLASFADGGFAPFRTEWDRLDVLRGRPVSVASGSATIEGTALGLSAGGALRVLVEGPGGQPEVHEFLAADVSVRPAGRPAREG